MNKKSFEKQFDSAVKHIQNGDTPYWDADQILDFADYAEDENFLEDYKIIVSYGRKLHPNNTDLYIKHCRYYHLIDENDKALSMLRALPNPHMIEYDELYITCLFLTERDKEAIDYATSVVDRGADYAEELLAVVHEFNINEIENDEQRDDFTRMCFRLFPNNTFFQDEYCELLSENKQYEEAIHITLQIIEKHPYNYEAWFNLGRLYACLDQYSKAAEALEFAVTCEREEDLPDPELENMRAFCHLKTTSAESLVENWNKFLSIPYSEQNKTDMLMDTYYLLSKFQEGYDFLCESVSREKVSIPLHSMICYFCCCVELSKEEEATAIFDYMKGMGEENNVFTYLEMVVELRPSKESSLNRGIVNLLNSLFFSSGKSRDLQNDLYNTNEEEALKEDISSETLQTIANSFFTEVGRNN